MTMNYDVLVVGNYSVDLIFTGLPQFPELGKDVIGTGFAMTPGEAYISAVSMHRLGMHVGWAADFGTDSFSQFTLEKVRAEGLDESLFVFHDRPLRRISVSASFVTERGFITYYDPDPKFPAALKALSNVPARILFIPGLFYGHLLDAGIKLVRLRKMIVVMDGNSSQGDLYSDNMQSRSIQKALRNTDIFLPNTLEATRLTGEKDAILAMRILGKFCPLVVLKDGVHGCYACRGDNIWHAEGIPVDPLDTTGAGDNFDAGFLRAWLDGRSIESCLQWGNIVGGLSTTALGGTTRVIRPDDVDNYLSDPLTDR